MAGVLWADTLLPSPWFATLGGATLVGAMAWAGPLPLALAAGALATLAALAQGTWADTPSTWASCDRALGVAALDLAAAFLSRRLARFLRRQGRTLAMLERRAFCDRLTDLPNRPLFLDRLAMAIAHARRDDSKLVVLSLDLDGFKAVNDRHGHGAGDDVLRAVAARLRHAVRSSDTVARLGGDEFLVLLTQLHDARDAARVATAIRHAIAAPIRDRSGRQHTVGVSVGAAVFPDDAVEIDRLLACADAAMYASKRAGRNRCTFFAGDDAMPAADWIALLPEHHVGVPEIDRQHRQLVQLANELNAEVAAAAAAATVRARLLELLLYARYHFATEERLMRASDYADTAAHAETHARLLAELEDHAQRLEHGGELLALQTLKDWLFEHILADDRALGAHLQRQADGPQRVG